MGSLFLIRHGQARYGEVDYDRLTDRGVEQARSLTDKLGPLDAIYRGPHVRHRETAEHAGLAAARELPGFAEYPAFQLITHFMPKVVGSSPDEAFRTIMNRWSEGEWNAPDVESVADFVARVRSGLEHVIDTSKSGARIAIVTSAGPIGVALGLVMGLTPERMIRASTTVRNTSITELVFRRAEFAWHPDKISLVTFNATGHLSPALMTDR